MISKRKRRQKILTTLRTVEFIFCDKQKHVGDQYKNGTMSDGCLT